jgi:arginyl-tRNA synthetase
MQFPKHSLFQPPVLDGKQLKIFYHSKTFAHLVLAFIQDRNGNYGIPLPKSITASPKVLIEFSSPNIVAELNGKHFRSTLLGAQLVHAYEAQGWEVVKINYIGDWGKPIGLLGAGFERFGSDELLKTDPIGPLREIYRRMSDLFAPELAASKKARDDERAREEIGDSAEIESKGVFAERNAFLSRLENDDEKAMDFWRTFRDASVDNYTMMYSRLHVKFDDYFGESHVFRSETLHEVENKLKEKGICEESEGSLVIHLQNHGSKHGTAIIRDRTGSSTYLLRELASAIERYRQHAFDRMVYVVANDQHTTHFHRLAKILELLDMGDLASKLQHVPFNESSHLPEFCDPDEPLVHILDRCEEAIQKSVAARSSQLLPILASNGEASNLTASAFYAQASSVRRTAELKFDIEKMTSFEPGTALYFLQWSARLSSIEMPMPDLEQEQEHYLDDVDNAVLLRWLAHLPEVVKSAFRNSEPTTLFAYLGNVINQLAECYEEDESIAAASTEHRQFLGAVGIVISNVLRLLGITR